jgi:hypothetical protein
MPPMTAAKKINTATKSNPVTIFLFRVALGNRRRGSNLEDRMHPTRPRAAAATIGEQPLSVIGLALIGIEAFYRS